MLEIVIIICKVILVCFAFKYVYIGLNAFALSIDDDLIFEDISRLLIAIFNLLIGIGGIILIIFVVVSIF